MVKISVIVPIYNDEKYLKECLDSIITQGFSDIEIICVNDGSTDKSGDILNEYALKDNRIKVIDQDHFGTSTARNAGLDNAIGDYIYFTDSDDYIEPGTLETIYTITHERDLDMLIFKLATFTNDGNERNYDYSNMPFLKKFGDEVFSFEDIKDHLLEIDVTVYTKFFRKEIVSDIRFENGLIFEDNLFFIACIFKAYKICFYDECLYNKRVHEHSIISTASREYVDIITIFNKIDDTIKDYGYYGEFKEKLFMRKVDAINYRFDLINPEYKEFFFNAIKKDYAAKQKEYEEVLDFSKINDRSKIIFNSVLSASTPREFEIQLKISTLENNVRRLRNENQRLKKENKSLKDFKKSILNSNSWKITKPLRKIRNL